VTTADTRLIRQCSIVPVMVTQKPKGKAAPIKRRSFYLREWRKYMGTKATECAEALDIERESYYRLEREWWTINAGEQDMAKAIGVKPSQFWFPPPKEGQQERISVEELLDDIPENMRPAALLALRGMAGK